jgi:hypothetical protein
METFVEIINKNACQPSSNLTLEGVEANSSEWKKHNFYPQNGIVGLLVAEGQMHIGKVLIIQALENIFIPIEPNGVRYISKDDFLKKLPKNKEIGFDRNNENDNSDFKQFMNDFDKMMGF